MFSDAEVVWPGSISKNFQCSADRCLFIYRCSAFSATLLGEREIYFTFCLSRRLTKGNKSLRRKGNKSVRLMAYGLCGRRRLFTRRLKAWREREREGDLLRRVLSVNLATF